MRVEFPKPLCERMRKSICAARRREIGGILMAEQLEPGSFRIVDFSVDPITGTSAHFVRSIEHHQQVLADFFEKAGSDYSRFNYLGEWHSHPNHPPVPSSVDVRSMTDLVNGERKIPFAALLIVRARIWRRMECSLTLFQQNRPPEGATLIPVQ